MHFSDRIDFSLSFTETAAEDADMIYFLFDSKYSVYNYKHWLMEQSGSQIISISKKIYRKIPCIILVTKDWYTKPATILEMNDLRVNDSFKVVIDYEGDFEQSQSHHKISNYTISPFRDDVIDSTTLERLINRKMAQG